MSEQRAEYIECLGRKGDKYYFTSSFNEDLVTISDFTEISLLKLQTSGYWEKVYPGKKTLVNWFQARSDLMARCHAVRDFDGEKVRGVGVWQDGNKTIIHLGDRLFCDGEEKHIHSRIKKDWEYFYERDTAVPSIHEKPLSLLETRNFVNLIHSLRFSDYRQGSFLAGWIACANIGGMLPWRPHIWITGEAGSGKSTIKEQILSTYFRHSFYHVEVLGESTEPGIRQKMGPRSGALVIDEFEPGDKKSREKCTDILQLTRKSSSDTEAPVIKGTPSGKSISYSPRFMAAFLSVKPFLNVDADITRFTYINMEKVNEGPEQWEELKKLLLVLTEDYCRRLFSRIVLMIPIILKNQIAFQNAISKKYSQRVGQQYGTLLAGYVALREDGVLTSEKISEYIEAADLDKEAAVWKPTDQKACLGHLLEHPIRLSPSETLPLNSVFKELSQIKTGRSRPANPFIGSRKQQLIKALDLIKIRLVKNERIMIAITNGLVDNIYKDSQWSGSWKQVLKRVKGCEDDVAKTQHQSSRCLSIPLSEALDEETFDDDGEIISESTKNLPIEKDL